ncbi:Basigin [Fragariocoptes setiger]|uniref:Basigin n=1 Tax=Fragariocoptes setiger TaxID=1670756 RepID=A0ABQ7S8B5_9ACAR|nr:Basigin [Fragariocoptes setiger]
MLLSFDAMIFFTTIALVLLTIALNSGASANIVIQPADRVVLIPGHALSLRCNVADYPQTQFRWYRIKQPGTVDQQQQSQQEEELLPDDDRFVIHNNNIIIKSPTMNDVGDYFCRVWPEDQPGIERQKMVSVRAKPFIHDFDIETSTGLSAVLTEGQKLVLNCNVHDQSQNLEIQWFKSKFSDDDTEMQQISLGDSHIRIEEVNATSKTLIIDSIKMEDRRYYKCQVGNGVTENNKIILIRVRDKIIALWPAIGIITELVILFSVIFITENRKVEPDFDDGSGRKVIQQM